MPRNRLDVETQRFDASELAKAARQMDQHVSERPTPLPAPMSGGRTSEVRIANSRQDDPLLDKVPVLVASEDDLAWFGLEVGVQAVLSLIDGTSSVRIILTRVPMAAEAALSVLRELEAHQVVAME